MFDIRGKLGGVDPTPPRGRDKSGPYGPDIASLVVFGQFATSIMFVLTPIKSVDCARNVFRHCNICGMEGIYRFNQYTVNVKEDGIEGVRKA